MFNELKVNDIYLPLPDENLQFTSEKVKKEYESEAGTTVVSIIRDSKLTIKGNWTLSGKWMNIFRSFFVLDIVEVECFYPSNTSLRKINCQFQIDSESHIKRSKQQLNVDGLYKVGVTIKEL